METRAVKTGPSGDDLVIIIVLALCLITPICLTAIWSISGTYFPPILLSALFGISVAALTYRYLGGTDGSTFSVGVLKVAGSAALLLGTTYLVNAELKVQMDAEGSQTRLGEFRRKNKELQTRNDDLEKQLADSKNNLSGAVAALSPTSEGGRAILDLFRKQKGPWATVEKSLELTVAIADSVKSKQFTSCADTGLLGRQIRLVRRLDEDDYKAMTATSAGYIDPVRCESGSKFSLQISCMDALQLFEDQIASCEKDNPKWKTKSGNRFFALKVDILN